MLSHSLRDIFQNLIWIDFTLFIFEKNHYRENVFWSSHLYSRFIHITKHDLQLHHVVETISIVEAEVLYQLHE